MNRKLRGRPSRLAALAALALASSPAASPAGTAANRRADTVADRRAAKASAKKPAPPASSSGEDALLQGRIDGLIGSSPISSGRVSIEVRSLATGKLLYARDPNDLLNPASNSKIATAAAALQRLGPDYRFSTDVLADKSYAHGKAKQLFVKGRGDPSINTERLESFVRDLVHRGVNQIGDLILDDSFFDRETWGPGWETETSDKPYAAGVGALSLNRNSVGIYVLPAEKPGQKAHVQLEPEAHGFFDISSTVQTTRPGLRKRALPKTYALGERTRVTVSGRLPANGDPIILYRRVTDPTFYFGYTLKQLLQLHGVKVTGAVKRGLVPADAKFINSYDSPELGEVVRDMNKASSNFIAEMLVKTMGAEVSGAPGTWSKGIPAVEDALAELGLPKGSYQMKNGSGLNDANRFSSHQLVALLTTLSEKFPIAAELLASLPVAGRDGSLRLRMDGTEAAGRLRAKTGTLDRSVALSGFVETMSGEELVFSYIANDWNGRTNAAIAVADKLGVALASLGERPQDLAAEMAAELPEAEERSRIAKYVALGDGKDKKNLASLRTSARIERDPAVKLAAADALFRVDAESGTGPLLEALPAQPEAALTLLGRLRALEPAHASAPGYPVLGSLFDLAADGNPDAMSRLLALCPLAVSPELWAPPALAAAPPAAAAPGSPASVPDPSNRSQTISAASSPEASSPDRSQTISQAPAAPVAMAPADNEALARTLADGLADVAEATPDETFAAFKSAPPEQARAAAWLVGAGLAASSTETDSSEFATQVLAAGALAGPESAEARLWTRLLERRGARWVP